MLTSPPQPVLPGGMMLSGWITSRKYTPDLPRLLLRIGAPVPKQALVASLWNLVLLGLEQTMPNGIGNKLGARVQVEFRPNPGNIVPHS